MVDSFSGNGTHKLEWNYHLSDKVKKVEVVDNNVIIDDKFTISPPFKPGICGGLPQATESETPQRQ